MPYCIQPSAQPYHHCHRNNHPNSNHPSRNSCHRLNQSRSTSARYLYHLSCRYRWMVLVTPRTGLLLPSTIPASLYLNSLKLHSPSQSSNQEQRRSAGEKSAAEPKHVFKDRSLLPLISRQLCRLDHHLPHTPPFRPFPRAHPRPKSLLNPPTTLPKTQTTLSTRVLPAQHLQVSTMTIQNPSPAPQLPSTTMQTTRANSASSTKKKYRRLNKKSLHPGALHPSPRQSLYSRI
jgi:hypothetical protein